MLFMRFIGVSVDWTNSYVPAFTVAGILNPVMCLCSLQLVGRLKRIDAAWLKLVPVALVLAALPLAAAEVRPDLELANPALAIRLDPQSRGALASLVDRHSGRDFIAAAKPSTLFRLRLTGSDGKAREVTAADAGAWEHSVTRTPTGGELVLRYRNLLGEAIHVECRLRLGSGDGLSHWQIAVENHSPWSVQSVIYPVLQATSPLGPDWADDRLLSPGYWSGALRFSQGPKDPFPQGGRQLYPGPAPVQFLAYYDALAGLYVATYDSEAQPKHLGFLSLPGGVDLSVQHEVWKAAGQAWTMPYDVVVGTFQGDWQAAADIYKKWAVGQPWCARKLTARTDIPAWFLEGRPFVRFLPRAGEYTGAGMPPRAPDLFRSRPPLPSPGLLPRTPALFARVGRALGAPFVVVEYGWEKQAMWVNPDVFPPYGGDDLFRRHAAALRRDGNVLCAYISGTHWGVKKTGRDDYDGWEVFRRRGVDAAATAADQQPIVDRRPWTSNVRLCIGSPVTRDVMLDMVRGLVERGVGFVQYDQNVGGSAYECHNRKHSHPPGYGAWMSDATREFMQAARSTGKALDPGFVLTMEQPGEYHIPYLDGFNDRPYRSSPYGESVPVFNYLYHEYAVSFGGDAELGLHCPEANLIRLARSFAAGLLVEGPTLGPSYDWPGEELEYLASIAQAQRGYAHAFAILGRMLPAPRLEAVPTLEAGLLAGTRDVPTMVRMVQVPVVTASAWKSPAGKTGYLLANVESEPVRPILWLSGGGRWIKRTAGGDVALAVRDGKCEVPLGPREIALVTEE